MQRLLPTTFLVLSIFWTTLSSAEVDRRPLIHLTFERLPRLLEFLDVSPSFKAGLSQEEYYFFDRVLGIVKETQFGIGEKFAVEFSSDRSQFLLNPGEPERTVITSELRGDPLIFNLGLIQQLAFQLDVLDVVQILIHEYGRKVGHRLDTSLADRVAVKARDALLPYYQSVALAPGISLISLILPVMREGDPLALVDYHGRMIHMPLNLNLPRESSFWVNHEGLAEAGFYTGNFQVHRHLKYLGLNVSRSGDQIDLEFPVQITENFVYMGVSQGLRGLPESPLMIPVDNFRQLTEPKVSLVKLKKGLSLGWLENWGHDADQVNLQNDDWLGTSFELFLPDVSGMEANLRAVALPSGRVAIEGELSGPAESLHLRAGEYLWPLTVSGRHVSGEIDLPRGRELRSVDVVVDLSHLVPLASPLLFAGEPSDDIRPKVLVEQDGRIFILKAETHVGRANQVQIIWQTRREIASGVHKVGERRDRRIEIISLTDLHQSVVDGSLIVRFESHLEGGVLESVRLLSDDSCASRAL